MIRRLAALALAVPALTAGQASAQSLAPPQYRACAVPAESMQAPVGLVRYSAPDPAIAFSATTEAGLSLTRRPAFSAYLTRHGQQGKWRLWLLRDYFDGDFIPPDASLRFGGAMGAQLALEQRTKGDWQIFDIDPAQLLAAFPGVDRINYTVVGPPSQSGRPGRTHVAAKLDLARLRALLEWVEALDRRAADPATSCAVPPPMPEALDPRKYDDCRAEQPGRPFASVWWDQGSVRVSWQYRLGNAEDAYAFLNALWNFPEGKEQDAVISGEGGRRIGFAVPLAVNPDYYGLMKKGRLKPDDQLNMRVRISGDWGSREMTLRSANSRLPPDLVTAIAESKMATRFSILAPSGTLLQDYEFPAGVLDQAERNVGGQIEDLRHMLTDPLEHCEPQMSIIIT